MTAFGESKILSFPPSILNTKPLGRATVEKTKDPIDDDIGVHSETEYPRSTRSDGRNDKDYKYFTPFISERGIDQPRPLKVIYIGAGISGILAAIKFRQAVPNLELTIYEKNSELGGTWFENKYPGCACGKILFRKPTLTALLVIHSYLVLDVPSHGYQLSFESWTGWSHFFSGAEEILEYWKRVAYKYGVRRHIKFRSRCLGARWNESTGKWFVQILDESTPGRQIFEDSADVLITGTGLLNEWKWPSISGIEKFRGKLLHSACWDESYDMEVCNSV